MEKVLSYYSSGFMDGLTPAKVSDIVGENTVKKPYSGQLAVRVAEHISTRLSGVVGGKDFHCIVYVDEGITITSATFGMEAIDIKGKEKKSPVKVLKEAVLEPEVNISIGSSFITQGGSTFKWTPSRPLDADERLVTTIVESKRLPITEKQYFELLENARHAEFKFQSI